MQHSKEQTPFLTAEQRRQGVARILAEGVLRLHARAALALQEEGPSSPENPAKSRQDCLEVSCETVLSVHTG